MSSSRQLAAIMFTDIVGYTTLMGKDEQNAFELLTLNREMQKPIIEQFGGRWIKELGDGVMASFPTVTDAVNAATQIQQACRAANRFQLRIGIHLGEVVFENEDVFGDGVNIASRIQASATPGSIYVSESVYNNICNKKDFHTKFVKTERLKNVQEPVKVYQVTTDSLAAGPLAASRQGKPLSRSLWFLIPLAVLLVTGYLLARLFITPGHLQESGNTAPAGASIAVMPFDNLGADSTQEYFSDGVTESLITDLAQVPGLLVISRNSTFQYKNKAADPLQVGKQLKVRYILQGKVQQAGAFIRIHAQLVETERGTEVWARRFDSRLEDIFSVQDSISRHIIEELRIALEKDATSPPTKNLEAYDHYLRGRFLFRKAAANSRDPIDSAILLFRKAVALDPQFALAYASLGKAYTTIYFIYDPNPKVEAEAYVNIEKALTLDPGLAYAHSAKGDLTWTLSNGFPHEKAIQEYKRAIELSPNLVEAHEGLGSVYFHIGLLEEALRELRTAITIDPAGKFARPRIARVHWYQQQFDSALSEYSALPPSGWLREQAIVLWSTGKREEAFKTLEQFKKTGRGDIEGYDLAAAYAVLYAGMGQKQEAEKQIRIATEHGTGKSHFHHAEHLIASAYALMGNAPAAVEWLQKTADHGLPCYPLFANDPNLKGIRNDPGYIALMRKMKRQWEVYKATL